ncbi:helix-turn-helix domain-containing protein [Pedobacter nutrimenti]|uniref:AraC-like DNA-binding protein n=1 Tax=Pedobacter nutrimenti TaxID=1241337 RepID=A0A318UMJ8_9SPHI|nr:AraC family transcriptional regulator [Pedobacter nutrimenti]PYF76647.1 AraC-like DNA-binding protein [Pedobacter nutrimenti]
MTLFLFFTSICCFFLLLFSLHLFFAKRGSRLLNSLLSVLFFARFGQVLLSLLVHSNESQSFPFFYQFFTPFFYAAPACFYLYLICFISGRQHLLKLQWLHFVPALLALVDIIPWFSPSPIHWNLVAQQIATNKQLFITERTGLFPASFYYLGRPLLILTYLALSWYRVYQSGFFKKQADHAGKQWISFFLKTSAFFQLAGFLPLLLLHKEKSMTNELFTMISCSILLLIMIFVLHQPKLFYGYLFVSVNLDTNRETNNPADLTLPFAPGDEQKPAIKKLSLLPEQLVHYSVRMKEIMEQQRPYLSSDFQIADLARELHIPVHHCSFVLNKLICKNFRDWINEYRVAFFTTQYPMKAEKMTIESVAHECGFKSTATFYNAFKKETGMMPRVYFSQKKVS